VLSIYQTDIIIYGTDLAEYINHESPTLTAQSAQTGPCRRWCHSGANSSSRRITSTPATGHARVFASQPEARPAHSPHDASSSLAKDIRWPAIR
jgi:hypothetical protein